MIDQGKAVGERCTLKNKGSLAEMSSKIHACCSFRGLGKVFPSLWVFERRTGTIWNPVLQLGLRED